MDHKKPFLVNKIFFSTLILILITSCGSYQYSGYINDGIYQSNEPTEKYVNAENSVENENGNNKYYQSAFSEKALMYSDDNESDQLFTDVENYRNSETDSIQDNYGPWGEHKDSVVINIHSHHHDSFWSSWRYPNWMWNYGFGYGNVWGYGYNNYWSRPFPYYGGMYNPFNPFWGYYDSFYYGYGYGYAYGYYPYWRPYNSWYNYSPYGRDFNTPVSLISGRRGSRNAISSRTNSLTNTNIRDRFNRTSSSSLSNRLSRIDRINNSARVNPNMYNKPFNSAGSSNSLSKPNSNYSSGYNSSSKPSSNYSKPSSNYSRPSNSSYKPSGSSNYSSPSYSRPSSSSNSSYSRGCGGISSGSSSPSRGGKSGR